MPSPSALFLPEYNCVTITVKLTRFSIKLLSGFIIEQEEQAKQSLCESLHNKLLSVQSALKVYCNRKPRIRRAVDSDPQYQAGSDTDLGKVNLATEYSEDYPIIFNISLWLLVVLVISLYVICLVMWYMDPGRDSIIYRMTSQRIKME